MKSLYNKETARYNARNAVWRIASFVIAVVVVVVANIQRSSCKLLAANSSKSCSIFIWHANN